MGKNWVYSSVVGSLLGLCVHHKLRASQQYDVLVEKKEKKRSQISFWNTINKSVI